MGNKLIIILTLIVSGLVFAWEIEDVNGTWADNEQAVEDFSLPLRKFSWGMGRSIPNSSNNIDLGEKYIQLSSGMGRYNISEVSKEEDGSIHLELFSVDDEWHFNPLYLKVTFIDYNRAYMVCYPQKGWWSRPLSPEEKWIWYRLSGPPRD
jgi:hypothetical protein